jgi:hypothetical protein
MSSRQRKRRAAIYGAHIHVWDPISEEEGTAICTLCGRHHTHRYQDLPLSLGSGRRCVDRSCGDTLTDYPLAS